MYYIYILDVFTYISMCVLYTHIYEWRMKSHAVYMYSCMYICICVCMYVCVHVLYVCIHYRQCRVKGKNFPSEDFSKAAGRPWNYVIDTKALH